MNNDLISRSELKQALCEFMKNNIGIYSNEMFHLVDSMPTAEEKPQGEWDKRHTELLKYFVKCEKCGEEIMTSHKNFCPNCGENMQGDEK